MNIIIYIFSYNRGVYLINTVNSILDNFTGKYKIVIVDDDSSDSITIKILDLLKKNPKIEILIFSNLNSKLQNDHLGGLRSNMNNVIKNLHTTNEDGLVIFLQDDVQIVREVNEEELLEIKNLSETLLNPFIGILFIKQTTKIELQVNKGGYFALNNNSLEYYGFADIFAISKRRLRESIQFSKSEIIDNNKYHKMFGPMTIYKNPFAMYMVKPSIERKNDLNIFERILDKLNGGYFVYKQWGSDENSKFTNRSIENVPYSEVYLEIVNKEKNRKLIKHTYRSTSPTSFRQRFIYYAAIILNKLKRH